MDTDLSDRVAAVTRPLHHCTFLVVDDFSTMRHIVAGLVRELGCDRIVEAEDGFDACRKLEQGSIDFVISDWNMPGMTGLDLLKRLRAHEATAGLPFLLITAEARKDNIVEAARAGADGYIVKPFTAAVLRERVTQIFRRRSVG